MKKFTFFAALLITLTSAIASKAQSFHMEYGDTLRKGSMGATGDVTVLNHIINTTSSDMTIDWKILAIRLDSRWKCNGICDNIKCYASTDITVGNSFTTAPFSPGPIEDFHVLLNGDDAVLGTSASVTLQVVDPASGQTDTVTFIAVKNTTGISVVKVDENAISVYPNPAQNYIDVHYPANADVRNIIIYNLIGKQVGNFRVTNNTSAHCEFGGDTPSGIYIVRLVDSRGSVVSTRRFTKQ